MYEPRTYRHWVKDGDLVSFQVTVRETDLLIRAGGDFSREALAAIIKCRGEIEGYIRDHPSFLTSLNPITVETGAPALIQEMARAAGAVSLGPMSAVAGAIAEAVGRELLSFSPEVIVENGGDIYLKLNTSRLVGVYAGDSPLTGRIALQIDPDLTPLGVCTSSGTVGHSLSFGTADAVIALAPCAALADAVATAAGNLVETVEDIERGIEFARGIAGLKGVIIIKDDRMGMWGAVSITEV